jgi:hypothetical protein
MPHSNAEAFALDQDHCRAICHEIGGATLSSPQTGRFGNPATVACVV